MPITLYLGNPLWSALGSIIILFLSLAVCLSILAAALIKSNWYKQKEAETLRRQGKTAPRIEPSPSNTSWPSTIILGVGFIAFGWYFFPPFLQFQRIQIFPDNHLVLKNNLGITVGRIEKDEQRLLLQWENENAVTGGATNFYTTNQLQIATANRTHTSREHNEAVIMQAASKLRSRTPSHLILPRERAKLLNKSPLRTALQRNGTIYLIAGLGFILTFIESRKKRLVQKTPS